MFRPRNIVDSGCWHIDDVGPANLSDEDQLEHLKMSFNNINEVIKLFISKIFHKIFQKIFYKPFSKTTIKKKM